MINYIEKGNGLHIALEKAGLDLSNLDGVYQSLSDHTVVNQFIADFNPLLLAQANAITAIKQRASELILEKLPAWKQANLTVAALIIIAKPARGLGALTQADLDEITLIESNYVYPVAIRARSDIEEASILAETNWELVRADFTEMEAI